MRGLIRAQLLEASDEVVSKQIASTAIDNTAKNVLRYQPQTTASVTSSPIHQHTNELEP